MKSTFWFLGLWVTCYIHYIKLVAIICVWITCYIYCRIVVVIICMSDTCYILYRTIVAIICLWLTCYSHYMKVFAIICMSIAGCIHLLTGSSCLFVYLCSVNLLFSFGWTLETSLYLHFSVEATNILFRIQWIGNYHQSY